MELLFIPIIHNLLNLPDIIIKCADCNSRPIQNCTSNHQMKLCTVNSVLIISRRSFVPIKWYRSSDPVNFLLCNHCEVQLSDKDTNKAYGPQFIWSYLYWNIIRYKDIRNHYSYKFIWKIVPLDWHEWCYDDIVLQFLEY